MPPTCCEYRKPSRIGGTKMQVFARTILMMIVTALPATHGAVAQQSPAQACLAIADENARLGCIRGLLSQNASPTGPVESWNVIRSRDPSGARIVSIARSADPLHSDLDFAGLMIRCTGQNVFEVAIALVAPLPLRSKRTVKLASGPASFTFEGESIPPGSLLLMPPEATDAINAWKDNDELKVAIETSPADIKGRVPLAGLAAGMRRLTEACAVP